jgi:hypothetical protein
LSYLYASISFIRFTFWEPDGLFRIRVGKEEDALKWGVTDNLSNTRLGEELKVKMTLRFNNLFRFRVEVTSYTKTVAEILTVM